MPAVLTNTARLLLEELIHSNSDTWWSVIKTKKARNRGMGELLGHKLIEIHPVDRSCRATERGVRSNELWRAPPF